MVFIYLSILIANFSLGTIRIFDARQNNFRGGACGECQTCVQPICDSQFGFDIYYLYFSFLLFTFIIGFVNVIFDKNLPTSVLIAFIYAIAYLVLTEILIKIFSVPVLYTHFQEGRQSLSTSAFSQLNIGYNIFPLFLSVISGFAGNIIGFPFLVIRKRLLVK